MKFAIRVQKTLGVMFLSAALVTGAVVALPGSASAEDGRKVKAKVSPAYPDIAKTLHLTGTVKLEATVTATGQVRAVKVIGGHPMLASAAEDALKKWKYEPGSGESTEVVEFHFTPGM